MIKFDTVLTSIFHNCVAVMQVFPAGIWLWIIKLSKPSRKIYFNSKIIDLLENYRGNHSIGENLWSALYLILCLLQTNAAEMLNGIASIWMLFHMGNGAAASVCVCLCIYISTYLCISCYQQSWKSETFNLGSNKSYVITKNLCFFFSLNHTGRWILTN